MKRLLTDLARCCCCFIALLSVTQSLPVQNITGDIRTSETVNRTASDNVCVHEDTIYAEGQRLSTSNPCETCTCDPPGFSCSLSSCDLKPGCKAIHKANQCCPEYVCECERNGKIYGNGEKVEEPNPCKVCYCKGGEIKCALVTCYTRDDCEPGYVAGVCCPKYDHCPPLEMMKNKTTAPAPAPVIISDLKTEPPSGAKTKDHKKVPHLKSEAATEATSPSQSPASETPADAELPVVMMSEVPPETSPTTYAESSESTVRTTEPATETDVTTTEEIQTTEGFTSTEGVGDTEGSETALRTNAEALGEVVTWTTPIESTTVTEGGEETTEPVTTEVTTEETTGGTERLNLREGPLTTTLGYDTTEEPTYSTTVAPELQWFTATEAVTVTEDAEAEGTHQTYRLAEGTEAVSTETSEVYTTHGGVVREVRDDVTTVGESVPTETETPEVYTTLPSILRTGDELREGSTTPEDTPTTPEELTPTTPQEVLPTTTETHEEVLRTEEGSTTPEVTPTTPETGEESTVTSTAGTEVHPESSTPVFENLRVEIHHEESGTEEGRGAVITTEPATDYSTRSVVKVIVPKTKDMEVVERNADGPAPIVVMISADQIQFLKLAEEPPMYVENRNSEEEERGEQEQLGVVVVPRTTPTTVEMVKVVRGTLSAEGNTTVEDFATKVVSSSASANSTDFIRER